MLRKISILLICIMVLFVMSACSFEVNGDNVNLNGGINIATGTYLEKEENISENIDGISKFEIENTAGNIEIRRSDSGEIRINAVKKVKGLDDKVKREIMDNIKIDLKKNGDTLILTAKTRDSSGLYLWDWVNKIHKALNVTVNYNIQVPDGIKILDVRNTAGNTDMEAISGEIHVNQNAGNIKMSEVALAGDSTINLNAGNSTLDIAVDKAESLDIRSTAGNVTITLPGQSKFSLETKLVAGNLSGSFLSGTRMNSGTLNQDINGGGPKVKLTLTAGNAVINKK